MDEELANLAEDLTITPVAERCEPTDKSDESYNREIDKKIKEIDAIIRNPWLKFSLNMNTSFNAGYEYVPEIYTTYGLVPSLEEFENECSAELAEILKRRDVPAKRLIVPPNFEEAYPVEAHTPLLGCEAAAINLSTSDSENNDPNIVQQSIPNDQSKKLGVASTEQALELICGTDGVFKKPEFTHHNYTKIQEQSEQHIKSTRVSASPFQLDDEALKELRAFASWTPSRVSKPLTIFPNGSGLKNKESQQISKTRSESTTTKIQSINKVNCNESKDKSDKRKVNESKISKSKSERNHVSRSKSETTHSSHRSVSSKEKKRTDRSVVTKSADKSSSDSALKEKSDCSDRTKRKREHTSRTKSSESKRPETSNCSPKTPSRATEPKCNENKVAESKAKRGSDKTKHSSSSSKQSRNKIPRDDRLPSKIDSNGIVLKETSICSDKDSPRDTEPASIKPNNRDSKKGDPKSKRKHGSDSDKTEHSPSPSHRSKKSPRIDSISNSQLLLSIDTSNVNLIETSNCSARVSSRVTEPVSEKSNDTDSNVKCNGDSIEGKCNGDSKESKSKAKRKHRQSSSSSHRSKKSSRIYSSSSDQSESDKSGNSPSHMHSCKKPACIDDSSFEQPPSSIDISKVHLEEISTSSISKLCVTEQVAYSLNVAVVNGEPESDNFELSDSSTHNNKTSSSSTSCDQPPIRIRFKKISGKSKPNGV